MHQISAKIVHNALLLLLLAIFVILLLPHSSALAAYSLKFAPVEDVGKNGKIYAGRGMWVTIEGCYEGSAEKKYATFKSDEFETKTVYSVDADGSLTTDVIIKNPGTHTVKAHCCRPSQKGQDGCRGDPDVSAKVEVLDTGTIKPEDLQSSSCEVCHPDWPGYDGSQTDSALRCRGAKTPDDDKWKYTLKPIRIDACTKGYECVDHTIGCTIPTIGIDSQAPPCAEGKDALGTTTTDKEKITTCTKFSTGLSLISVDSAGFVTSLLGILLSMSGMIALFLIIRSGYQLMMSRGNPEAIQEARERLTSAIVGLLLIIFSLVIMSVIGVDVLKIPGFS